MQQLPQAYRPAFFEMLGYAVKGAYQMNRKFLMAQKNHETGSEEAAREAQAAFDSINALTREYNTLLSGKWNQMISTIPPGYTAKYHLMPELVKAPTTEYRLPKSQERPEFASKLNLSKVRASTPFRLIEGIGTDWLSLQLGEPFDPVQNPASLSSSHIDLTLPAEVSQADSITLCISAIPFWPIATDRSNRFGVSVDGCTPVVCENQFEEWGWTWKLQVIENRKDFVLTLPIDRQRKRHTLSLIIGDPGQMIQKITYQ